MSLRAGMIVPHPPIVIPEIGRDRVIQVQATVKSMLQVAADIRSTDADTLVFISPHSRFSYDTFLLRGGERARGSLALFGYPNLKNQFEMDEELAVAITDECRESGLPAAFGNSNDDVDHGILVPFYFIGQKKTYRIVSLSISGLPLESHYRFGEAIGRTCERYKRKIAIIASGDLSHRLTIDAPAGYSPRGADFDKLVCEIVSRGDLAELRDLDYALIEAAGECGLRSFVTLGGALKNKNYTAKLLSYEGPFGVGYMVAEFII